MAWRQRGYAVIIGGIEGVAASEVRVLTLTAPGYDVINTADALVAFNRTWGERWHLVWSAIRRACPGAEFVRVVELQRRGAIHLHVVVRGASSLSRKRVRRFAVSAGFGPRIDWTEVKSARGVAGYLAGYLMKSRDEFPSGTRVLESSRGWSLRIDLATGAEGGTSGTPAPVSEDPVDWYGGPPPGVTWWDWAGDRPGIQAGRLYKRRERARRALESFEARMRDHWARWARSASGEAARARLARKGPPEADGR